MATKNKHVFFDAHLAEEGGSFMRKRFVEFRVKQGSLRTLSLEIQDSEGGIVDLTNTTTYASGKWKVWRTDKKTVINGNIVFNNRAQGIVEYTLVASDTVNNNAGVFEGEVELYDNLGNLVEQSDTFTFIIEDSA